MSRNKADKLKWIMAAVMVAIVIGCHGIIAYSTAETVTVTVTKTDRISTGSGESLSHKYLVFTGGETFQNTDSMWYWKFNSSDIHGRLNPGTYRMKVYGWRFPFMSQYRNIVEVTPQPGDERL